MIDPRLDREEGESLLAAMLDSIRHRGPDASATWVDMPVLLGHNRLSIIDLSDLGNQPMAYDDLVIGYNGEVYNYLEIRRELEDRGYPFRSHSDTEVILAAYKEWGADCVQRFVGMWAFAIWDRTQRELFCSRDRFGIKPFYYIHAGDRFYFGSEYKPLKLSPLFRPDLNLDHVRRGLQVGAYIYRDETYYECLRALPERCNLLFKDGAVTVTRYWDIDAARKSQDTFDEKAERFRELFHDSIRLHMRSDVPVGGMLSGGLDSSSISSVVGREFPEVRYKTYTIYYDGWKKLDERPWAAHVTGAFPNLEPVVFSPSEAEIAESWGAMVHAFDTPLQSPTPVSCYFVMKAAARDGIKVLLDGQGADEILAGYDPVYDRQIAGHLRHLRLGRALRALHGFRRRRSADLGATARVAATAALATMVGEERLWMRHFRPTLAEALRNDVPYSLDSVPGSRLDQYLYNLIFGSFLPSFLHYGDRMSMAWSVESRVPFLDHRLVELAFALDDDDKVRDGQTKYVLRKALHGVVPPPVLMRSDKQPFFGGETSPWLRGPLRFLLDEPLHLDGLGFVDNRRAAAAFEQFRNGNDWVSGWVFSLAGLNYWLNRQ